MKVDLIENLNGCKKIPSIRYSDNRGSFQETWNQRHFDELNGAHLDFVQDNFSISHQNVLRGLHFQNPHPQGKLIKVITGSIIDVVVDLRESSETFCHWSSIEISSNSDFQLWVPSGFAHGFLSLEDNTSVYYKVTNFWHSGSEYTLKWDDPDLSIEWPKGINPIVSKKDKLGLKLSDLRYFD